MAVAQTTPSEITGFTDEQTGRRVRQLTAGSGHDYHLYYQAYSMSRDGRWLAFYSERTGATELYRLDRRTGQITQLTQGRSGKAGWWPWTGMDSQGVYAYISCLNLETNDVYYHDLDEIRAVNLDTLEDRLLTRGPQGKRPFSQMACSFDGRRLATVWVDQAEADRSEASMAAARASGNRPAQAEHYWEKSLHSQLDVIDTRTGESTTLLDVRAALHNMAFAADNRHVLAVTSPHYRGELLSVDIQNPGQHDRIIPPKELGRYCHFHACENGLVSFDSNVLDDDLSKVRIIESFLGHMKSDGSAADGVPLGHVGYIHVGHDLAGEFLFGEIDGGGAAGGHHLAAVVRDDGTQRLERITDNLQPATDQRWHAHPVLTPERSAIIYTALGDDGVCHIFDVAVGDLTGVAP